MDHLCPKCKTLMRIIGNNYVYRDGHLYIVQELACKNPKCSNDETVKVETELEVTNE